MSKTCGGDFPRLGVKNLVKCPKSGKYEPKKKRTGRNGLTSVKNKNEKGMVRSTFARAFQIRGENFDPKSAKLSGASQIKRFFVIT